MRVQLVLTLTLVGVTAHEQCTAQEQPRLKTAYVPADEPNEWPEGNWSLIATDDLVRFQNRAESEAVSADGVLEQAVYRGRLIPNDGLVGECEWMVIGPAPRGGFVDLGEPTLSIETLIAGDEPTIWGTSPDDRRLLLAPPGRSSIAGSWSARGQLRFGRLECEFDVPPAGMNRLELTAPADWALIDASGLILGPHMTNDTGSRRWDVELGRRTRCWLHWGQAASSTPQPDLQCERTLTYSIRPDGSRLQADFSIGAYGNVPQQLTFRLPPQLGHPTVSWSTGTYLPGRLDDSVAGRFIVPLPTLNPGHLGVLRIVADMPTIEDDDWLLPEIELENCRLISGTRAVAVNRPLTMKNYDVDGLRAIGVDDDERGTDWSFTEELRGGSLKVRVARPAPRFVARIVTEVDGQGDASTYESIIEITTRAGSAFFAEFQLPRGWDVLDVQALNGDSALTGWTTDESDSGIHLMVEFRQAMYGQSKKTLRIVGRGPPAERPDPLPIPVAFVDWELLWGVDGAGRSDSANPPRDDWDDLLSLLQTGASARSWRVIDPASATRTPTIPAGPTQLAEPQPPARVRHADPAGAAVSSLHLETWIVPGESFRCRHRATFPVSGAPSGLQFSLDPSATLDAVLVDGVLHATESRGQTTVLASLPPGARAIQVRYHTETANSGPLSTRLRIVVPEWNMPVGETEWRVHVPEGWLAFVDDAPARVSWTTRLFGWVGREAGTPGDGSDSRAITYRAVPFPRTLSLRVWNSRQRALAYIMTLLITASLTIGLRLTHVLRNALWYPLSLGGAACAALLASATAVPVLSGLVVGLIAGGMFPRDWITIPDLSSGTPRLSPRSSLHVARLAILVSSVATTLVAQQPTGSETVERTSDVAVDALIPIAEDGPSPFSYLDAGLMPEVRRWIADHPAQPSTLIRSARYEPSASDAALIHATFEVISLAGSAALRLPLNDVMFRSPDDCFVDGQRRTIRPAADGNGYFIDLDAPREQPRSGGGSRVVEVSVWMRFRESSASDRREVAASIPRVIDSAVQLDGELLAKAPWGAFDPERNVTHFGGLRRLRLTRDATAATTPIGTATTMIEVHPLRLEAQTRLRLERDAIDPPESMRHVSVLLPPHTTVGEITGEGVQRSRVWTAEQRTVADVTFRGAEAAEDVLNLKYSIPVESDVTGIEIPPLELLEPGRLARHDIGIHPSAGFRIEQAPPTLPIETVAARFPRQAGWTEPEVAVSLEDSAPIAIALAPRDTRLEADISETVVVEGDRVSWEAVVDLDVSNSGTLRLTAVIPTEVHIDSCAVLQDGANRLLGWARDGDQVVMHLREDRVGAYEIVMVGWSTGEELVRVPNVDLVGATVVDRKLQLRNESRDRIEWLNADHSPIADLGDSPTSVEGDAADERPVFLRRTHTRDRFNMLTTVASLANRVAIGTYVQLDGSEHPPTVFIEVPPELAADARVEPQDWLRQTGVDRAGGLLLTIEPVAGAAHIALSTTATADGGRDPLRVPRVVGADVAEQFIAMSASARVGLVEPSASPMALDDVPLGLRDLIDPLAKVYRVRTPDWSLQHLSETAVAAVDLVQTGVWETRSGLQGRTLVYMRSDDAGVVRIRRPPAVQLDSMMLDGRAATTESVDGQVTVHLDAPGLHHLLLRWSASGQAVDADSFAVPAPADPGDFPHLAAVVLPESETLAPDEPGLKETELRTQRVDALLSSLERLPAGTSAGVAEAVQTLSDDIAACEGQEGAVDLNWDERSARWEDVRANVPETLTSDLCRPWAIPTGVDARRFLISELDNDDARIVIPKTSWMALDATLLIVAATILATLAMAVRLRVERFDSAGRRIVLLGALWWMCFRLAPLGLVLMAVGIAVEVITWRRAEQVTPRPAP